MKTKRLISLFLMLCVLFSNTAYAADDEENNIIAQKNVQPISPGLVYSRSIEIFDGVRQEIYSFKLSPGKDTKIVPAYGQYIYGFNSVGKLISSYEGEGSVVGGINTDFFITETGIPLSCLIEDNEIITSCDHRAAIGFTADGNAVIGYPEITADFISEGRTLHVSHINKTPGIWGAYLVTDKFSKTTKTSFDSIEIVFKSYNKEETDKAIEEFQKNAKEADESGNENSDNIESVPFIEDETTSLKDNSDVEGEEFREAVTTSQIEGKTEKDVDKLEISENSEEIDTVNNDNSDDNIDENIIDEKVSEELQKGEDTNEKFSLYSFTEEAITKEGEIDVVVTEIRDGVRNGVIEEGTYVLCIPKEQLSYLANGISVGDRFTLKVQSSSIFDECQSVFGVGSIIVENGEFKEQTNDSIFRYRNPRTAAGITTDGEIIFVCVDGRRPGESNGFTIKELADYLISLGCVSAVNFDGGGSTTFYAQGLGEMGASLKNTPSEGIERKVADGLLFVNTTEPNMERTYAALYPNRFLTFNENVGIDISGDVKFADSNFYPMQLSEDESIVLSVDTDYGSTVENIFVPNGKTGEAEIFATIPEGDESYLVGYVDITDTVNELCFKSNIDLLTPFCDFAELFVSPHLNTVPVAFSHLNVEWKIEYETEDENGETILTDADSSEAFVLIEEDGVYFIPVKRDTLYKITATLGVYYEEIVVFAEAHPFADMEFHWASETSYEMYKSNLITGELTEEGIAMFVPSRSMTRAEFCAILSRALGLLSKYPSVEDENFDEESANDEMQMSELNDSNSETEEEILVDSSEEIEEIEVEAATSEETPADEHVEFTEENNVSTDKEELNTKDSETSESFTETEEYEEADNSEEIVEILPQFSMTDVPDWAKGYVSALYEYGYLDELLTFNEEGYLTVKANEYITRMDIIRVLGSILDGELNTDIVNKYADFAPEQENDSLYFSRIAESGIITGYEDGTVRQNGFLTRAEGATVFSRFIKYINDGKIDN